MRGKWFQIQNVKLVFVMYRFVCTMKQERGEIHESRDLVTLLLNDGNVCLFVWVGLRFWLLLGNFGYDDHCLVWYCMISGTWIMIRLLFVWWVWGFDATLYFWLRWSLFGLGLYDNWYSNQCSHFWLSIFAFWIW